MSKAKQQTVKPGIQQCCVQQASTWEGSIQLSITVSLVFFTFSLVYVERYLIVR